MTTPANWTMASVAKMRENDPVAYVRWLHEPHPTVPEVCNDCREDWPCATIRAITELQAVLNEVDGLGRELRSALSPYTEEAP